ncbi:MAG: hypothetical protein A3K09_02490 [Nitrospinae bacterium RIFCSPLOWO2_12_FULL_47_7]|nr:MAG: hypothetical protein A3K09_02490 [Nitrospinae bacterium RIFCSPLOWO2_12_FULL_47_7]
MDKPRKEPILLNERQNYKLCLNCGFPNRNGDSKCMYCNTSVVEDKGLVSWLSQTYYILRWRWQLKQKRNNLRFSSHISLLKGVGFFFFGALLSGVGAYLLSMAVTEGSFSNGLVALIFLLYGFFTIKTLLFKK